MIMYIIRSATFLAQKNGEFFPVYEENRKSGILAVFEHENDCVAVADRFNTIMYRHYGVDWETHPNAYAVVDDLHFEDILEVRQWGKVFGVFTRLCVDNAGVIYSDAKPRTFVLTKLRSTAEWIKLLLDLRWKRKEEEEDISEEDTSSTISTIVVEM